MKKIVLITTILLISYMSVYSQSNAPTYYGYWPCQEFFAAQKNGTYNMKSNCGTLDAYNNQFYDAATNFPTKKLLVDVTSYFWEDRDNNHRPDIEDIKYNGSWDSNLNALEDSLKKKIHQTDLTSTQLNNSLLGFIIEEPLVRGSDSKDLGIDFASSAMDYSNLKFVIKGRFCNVTASNGISKLDDIALVYNDGSGGIKIQIMKANANGSGMAKLTPWYSKPSNLYSINAVKFVVAGNFSGHTDGLEDLAIVYYYDSQFTIHRFISNGNGFTGNDYWTIFNSGNLDKSLLKYVTAGNYDNVSGDEIALFYRRADSSIVYMVKPDGNIKKWISHANTGSYGWDINSIKGVATGDFNGDNKDEIATLYDYPASSQGRIEVFTTNSSNNGFNEYYDWMTKSYSEINFNNVIGFYSGDFNFDKKDDLVLIDSTNYHRIIKLKSIPENYEFKDCWTSRRNFVIESYEDSRWLSFKKLKFTCVGNFYENVGDRNYFTDSYWEQFSVNNKRIDDVMLFYNDKEVICDYTLPLISFTDKEQLNAVSSRLKNHFPGKKTIVLYTETDTYMPSSIFATDYDWIGVDPYPFNTNPDNPVPFTKGWTQISNCVDNLLNKKASSQMVFIVGQAAEDVSSTSIRIRFPTPDETQYYYDKAISDSRIIGLFWWSYKDYSGQWNGIHSASTNLKNKHISIGESINSIHSLLKSVEHVQNPTSLITEFSLSQNYPNPFNPTTIINYSVPTKDFISLKIFDVLGREISSLVSKIEEPGKYSIHFDGSKLSSGIYIYKLSSSTQQISKKLLLIK